MLKRKAIVISFCLLFSSCTDPGETTGVASATGGVIGAGLGAIIGSQTGDAGAGVAIGAVAGASTGALVGNALEAQEESIRAQDEAIERNDRVIAAQRSELQELRRMGQDNTGVQGKIRRELNAPASPIYRSSPPVENKQLSMNNEVPVYRHGQGIVPSSQLRERDLTGNSIGQNTNTVQPALVRPESFNKGTAAADTAYGSYGWNKQGSLDNEQATTVHSSIANKDKSAECQQADLETAKARQNNEPAEKLFHYRRALRLCPSNPEYHNGLGEVYLSLNRKSDAEFEFKEALSVDPNYEPARRNIEAVRATNSNRF